MHSVSVSQSGSPQNGMHSTSITRSRWGIPLIIIIVALLYNACLPTQAKMEKEQSSSKKTQKEKVKTKEQTSEKKMSPAAAGSPSDTPKIMEVRKA